jgi:hypothetical protein
MRRDTQGIPATIKIPGTVAGHVKISPIPFQRLLLLSKPAHPVLHSPKVTPYTAGIAGVGGKKSGPIPKRRDTAVFSGVGASPGKKNGDTTNGILCPPWSTFPIEGIGVMGDQERNVHKTGKRIAWYGIPRNNIHSITKAQIDCILRTGSPGKIEKCKHG